MGPLIQPRETTVGKPEKKLMEALGEWGAEQSYGRSVNNNW